MATYSIEDGTLLIDLEGWDQLWSFKGSLRIDLSTVAGVRRATDDDTPPWLRAPGTHWPNAITAGTYFGKGEKEFWCTRHRGRAVVLDLSGADYDRVVVDLDEDLDIETFIRTVESGIR